MRKFDHHGKNPHGRLRELCLAGFIGLMAACANLTPPPEAGAGAGTSEAGTVSQGGSTSAGNAGVGGLGTAGSTLSGGEGGTDPTGGTGGAGMGGVAAGSGGTSSTSGTAGAASGSGGMAGGGCVGPKVGAVHAYTVPEFPNKPVDNQIHPFMALTTTGDDVAVNRFKLRYYFKGEGTAPWVTPMCIWVTQDGGAGNGLCSKTSLKISELKPSHAQADFYLEVSFAAVDAKYVLTKQRQPGDPLAKVEMFEVRSMFWRQDQKEQDLSNDYSYVATTNNVRVLESRAYRETSHVAVYLDDNLIWGQPPCD